MPIIGDHVRKLIFCLVSFFMQDVIASSTNYQAFPLLPRIMGQAAETNIGVFNGDVMAPIFGNQNGIWYLDGFGGYGTDKAWIGSVGTGFRVVRQDRMILGGYIFGDRNRTWGKGNFWVVNPGIEFMLAHWDLHINGYFPTSTKKLINTLGPASAFGINDFIRFQRHSRIDDLLGLYDIVGLGADGEIGYTIFIRDQRARLFLGGYHYSPEIVRNITGIQGGVELPVNNHLHFVFQDSYDNVFHNTASFAVQFIFGGAPQTEQHDLQERILDPIPRHLGSLPTGAGILSQKQVLRTGEIFVLENNLWFFRPGTGSAQNVTFESCTFENPCIGLDQTVLDGINAISPNAKLYLSPGQYDNRLVGSAYTLRNGQFIFGRTQDYTMLATGNDRALLNDSLFLENNNNIYNLRVNAQSLIGFEMMGQMITFQTGIVTLPTATGVFNIFNTNVISNSSTQNVAGIVLNSQPGATMNIYNSNTMSNALNGGTGLISVGTGNLFASTLNLIDSVSAATNLDVANNGGISIGVVNNEQGVINILRSNASSFMINGNFSAGVLNNATFGNAGIININQSVVTSSGSNAGFSAVANQANNMVGISGIVNITQSVLSATSTNANGSTVGVSNGGNGTVNIDATSITSTGDNGQVRGIDNGGALSTVNIMNTNIFINTSGAAIGDPIFNAGTVNDNGGNQCFLNGVPVSCL